jgi:hypothetical protein
MTSRIRLVFVLILFISMSNSEMLRAQLSQGGIPRSISSAIARDSAMITVVPPSLDILQREDEQTPVPYRFAINIPVDLGIGTSGNWVKTGDGSRIWRLNIQSPGALALTLYFDRFIMPEGGKLFVYNSQRTQVIGAFTSLNNNKSLTFATELIYGDQLTVEYDSPDGVNVPDLHISEVSHAYRGVSTYSTSRTGFGGSGNCEVNVNCDEGSLWQKEKRSVARIQVKRGGVNLWCTGSLVNNTLNDGKPYILTADHCGRLSTALDISQWIFYFNYEGTSCPNPLTEPALKSLTGAKLVAHGGDGGTTGSDFFMVLLDSPIPTSYNVYFNGWNRDTATPSPSGVTIHHPQGDIKKVSTYTQPLQQSNWGGGAHISHWLVTWSGTVNGHGTTEGGSSGSPLFDNQGRLVGTLTGGQSSCDSANLNSADYYGQFAYDWDRNGTDSINVLRYWLDPGNTNAMSLNGWALSVGEPLQADWLTIYPNPVIGQMNIKAAASDGKPMHMAIYDILGNIRFRNDLNFSQDREKQVDLSGLAPGMYMVAITDGDHRVMRKFIKQ